MKKERLLGHTGCCIYKKKLLDLDLYPNFSNWLGSRYRKQTDLGTHF